MQVEIQGYTDSIGTPQYNQLLSQKRAKAIQDYLVENGIPQERLSAKGYGEYNPIAGNESAAGRAQNRRSQFNPIY
jgi:outer membrane protein OmpA-like peptidoglycan-associated protein